MKTTVLRLPGQVLVVNLEIGEIRSETSVPGDFSGVPALSDAKRDHVLAMARRQIAAKTMFTPDEETDLAAWAADSFISRREAPAIFEVWAEQVERTAKRAAEMAAEQGFAAETEARTTGMRGTIVRAMDGQTCVWQVEILAA